MIKLIKALSKIRCELQDLDLKKSGKNAHMKFNYFELADFLPAINKLEDKHEVASVINMEDGVATLTLLSDTDALVIAKCNTAEAGNKGMQPIQAEGAMQTYIRRYLYMMGYGIVESDWVDCITDAPIETIDATKRQALHKLAGVKGIKATQTEAICKRDYGSDLKYITEAQYNELYEKYKKLPEKEKN